MMSLNIAFVEIYGELLAPYGYKKIKGRRPYFVRVVGDEIVHIISYSTRPMRREGYKEYIIVGGVATVYRYRINLDNTPRDNFGWLKSNLDYYHKSEPFGKKPNRFNELYTFSYKAGDEESMLSSVRHSFEITAEIMLPIFNRVVDLKTCMDYFNMYSPSLLFLYREEDFEGKYNEENEGLLNLKVYNIDGYIKNKENQHEESKKEMLNDIRNGKSGLTIEALEEIMQENVKGTLKQIETFKKYMNDPETNKRVMQELERRKKSNIEILRNYGLEI